MAPRAKSLIGKTVKVTKNNSNHGFSIGDKILITGRNNGCGGPKMWLAKNDVTGMQYNIYETDFKIVTGTKEEILKEVEDLKGKQAEISEEIDLLTEYVKFMTDNSLTEFNETEFKTYKVLQTINGNTSDLEKARIIAKILDSK